MSTLAIDVEKSNARGELVFVSIDDTIAEAARRPDYSTLTRDVPTITTIANNWFNAPTLAGSPGWMRPKRIGAAENAVGSWPADQGGLDLAGSTWFSYPGVVAGVASTGLPAEFLVGDLKPGGVSIDERWTLVVDFLTTSATIDFRIFSTIANANFGALYVDGHPATAAAIVTSAGAGVGAVVRAAFPSARLRRITAYLAGSVQFGGIAVEAGAVVRKAPAPAHMIALLGDSYAGGAASVSRFDTGPWKTALKLGADAIMDAAIGGTGVEKILAGAPTSNFAGRVPAILSKSPARVLIVGGRNDVGPTLQASMAALVASLAAIPTLAFPSASEAGQAAARAAYAAGAGSTYRNVAIDALPKAGDNIHPTFAGHEVFAYDAAKIA